MHDQLKQWWWWKPKTAKLLWVPATTDVPSSALYNTLMARVFVTPFLQVHEFVGASTLVDSLQGRGIVWIKEIYLQCLTCTTTHALWTIICPSSQSYMTNFFEQKSACKLIFSSSYICDMFYLSSYFSLLPCNFELGNANEKFTLILVEL